MKRRIALLESCPAAVSVPRFSCMVAFRIPLLALAALSLSAAAPLPAQQPAAPAPPGNLIIQVMDDDGTPFPGAAVEVDGMRTGAAPPGSAPAAPARANPAQVSPASASSAPAVGPEIPCPKPSSAQTAGAPSDRAHAAGSQAAGAQPGDGQPGSGQAGQSGQAGAAQPHNQTQGQPRDSAQPSSSQHCYLPPGSVLPGTAQSIGNLIGGAADGSGPPLPPGAVALATDAQGQLILQLPSGPHSVSVSVYGFEPFTGHFTLSGKHRQIVQIKLSASPPTYVFVVGPDSRVQLETPVLDSLIPLEPVQTLGPLPPRNRKRLL
jgi:hypothetical protein